jgi:inhibitor of KinA
MKFEIYPLSEFSVSLYLSQNIDVSDSENILSLCEWINKNPFEGFIEVVPSYSSLTVFYDLLKVKKNCKNGQTGFCFVENYLNNIPKKELKKLISENNIIEIPVSYKGPDLAFLSEKLQLTIPEIIQIHTRPLYRVYMLGFLPGFPYLGGLDKRICFPRKDKPRLIVEKGSIGIAGSQTGIYPMDSPGGWQIIGKTSIDLFDLKSKELTLFSPGDYVKFIVE